MNAAIISHLLNSLNNVFQILLFAVVVAICSYAPTANAQANPEISNCEELKDEATITQMDFCTAHVGCRLVMGIHTACTKVKKFIHNLKSIGERDSGKDTLEEVNSAFSKFKSFLGGKPSITSNQVFEASLSDEARALETRDKDWRERASVVKAGVAKAGTSSITEKLEGGGSYAYVGDIRDGKPNGWGTWFDSTGAVVRGEFKNGKVNGQGDSAYSDGARRIGQFSEHKQSGDGLLLYRTGAVYKGQFQDDFPSGSGAQYRPDGSLMSRGIYEKNELVNGERFNSTGIAVLKVDKVMDAMLAAESQQKTQAERMAREAEIRRAEEERQNAIRVAAERKRKEAAAAAEQDYRNSLNMFNAGQLFAKADELSTSGDKVKAREVLRTLLSRFPDHPLAATAAQQISRMNETATNSMPSNGQPRPQGNSSGIGATLALGCNESFDAYINSLPSFSGSLLRNIVRSLRADSALLMSEARAGKIVPSAYIPEYQRMLSGYSNSENTAFENHKKLSTSGPGAAMCNPQDGSQASAWAASRLGVAFATWALNTVQCVSGQQSPKPIPAFCPY